MNSVLLFLMGALISVVSFILGYMANRENTDDSYPFSSMSAVAMVVPRKRKTPWVAVLIVAIVAFLSFGFGAFAADPPNYGVTTYYGVHGREM